MNLPVFKNLQRMLEIDPCMRNPGAWLDPQMEEQLRAAPGGRYGHHNAFDFHGYVYFEENAFHEEVWQHRQPVKTVSARSLSELMKMVNDEFGWE